VSPPAKPGIYLGELGSALGQNGKVLDSEPAVEFCFADFYRIMRFNIAAR